MSTGMLIDGVFASEAIDSSGEILDVKGCDISDLESGTGVLNYEHRGDDAAGASFNDIIGRIVFCKKIYGADDCTDERQLMYWQRIQLPLIYGICRLFDGSGHPGAIAAAAMIRDYQKNGEPLLIRYSIEGTTLSKDKSSNRLTESVARRVAATIKPCNKSCHSGLLSDPNDPASVTKKEHPHPNFTPLGGSMELETSPVLDNPETIRKALAAGSYGGAPSTLTGGSALQVEDRGLRNKLKAAVRDWDRKSPFKKFLKHRMPEASDEFVDRFSDLVHDYTVRGAQKEMVKTFLMKKIVEGAKKKAGEKLGLKPPPAEVKPAPVGEPAAALTIRGQAVQPNPGMRHVSFDDRTGTLHTPRGSFPVYIPSRDPNDPDAGQKFANVMQDPKISKFHDYAMKNWTDLHQRLKNGALPPEVIMHGVLFSQLSPNTPVPMQEMMYSHLVDAMHHTGADPRNPETLPQLKQDWLNRDQPLNFPEHSREHFKRLENQLRLKRDSADRGDRVSAPRKAGDIGGYMLAESKFKNMSKYHTLHNSLVDLVSRHRHDARGAIEELMHHKAQAGLWQARRDRASKKGQPDPGEYTAGPSVSGLAPKTGRYMYGMLGGGNVMVPDTHFSRYLFGLDRNKDAETIKYLRNQVLWNENNSPILGQIDRYYGQNHDAVKHMLQHPVWGKHFENPEDAIFPAFWKNWVGIVPHEASRGMKTNGWNESTDHRPFWEAVQPYLNKAEQEQPEDPDTLPQRTARTHAEWVEKYGEMPAMLMYFHYLVPQLLEASDKRAKQQQVIKMEAKAIELRNLEKDERPQLPVVKPQLKHVMFQGKKVVPGKASVDTDEGRKNFSLLHEDKGYFLGVPEEKLGSHGPEDLVRLPKNIKPSALPENLEEPTTIDAGKHQVAEFVRHPHTQALVHGLELHRNREDLRRGRSFWTKGPNGKLVYVKPDPLESHKGLSLEGKDSLASFGHARREGLYHNLAHDFFGLGDYVAPTAVVHEPRTGREMAVVQHVMGEHPELDPRDEAVGFGPKHHKALKALQDSGELHKLALMNAVANNGDRHNHNFMIGEDGKLNLIDHGYTFGGWNLQRGVAPEYLYNNWHVPLHPEAAKWLGKLDPHELEMQMRRHGAPEDIVRVTSGRLKMLQSRAKGEPGVRIGNLVEY